MELKYGGSGDVFYNKKTYKCDLYINREYGGILIKISVKGAFASIVELPMNIDFISCQLSTGFKFSLLNCNRKETKGLVSEGRTVFTYNAEYMIEGVGGEIENPISFYKVLFELSDIIEWGNISGYAIGEKNEIFSNEDCELKIYENKDYYIKYIVKKSMLPIVFSDLLNENISLRQTGNIEITFKEEKSLNEVMVILLKIKRLIEISTLSKINIRKISGYNSEYYDIYGDRKYERQISIISSKINQGNNFEEKNSYTKKWGWIVLPELIENECFNNFFYKYEKLEPIIELYLQIIESNEMSNIRAFLNIVQALETYHSRFKANTLGEYKKRIDEVILKYRPKDFIENDKKFLMANSYKFITLESRIADLLVADFNIYFDTGDIEHLDFPNIIANTRNYYIHYDENIKKKSKILTSEELGIYTRALIYILEYYILIELGFSNFENIKKKLNDRWGSISQTLTIRNVSEKNNKNTNGD